MKILLFVLAASLSAPLRAASSDDGLKSSYDDISGRAAAEVRAQRETADGFMKLEGPGQNTQPYHHYVCEAKDAAGAPFESRPRHRKSSARGEAVDRCAKASAQPASCASTRCRSVWLWPGHAQADAGQADGIVEAEGDGPPQRPLLHTICLAKDATGAKWENYPFLRERIARLEAMELCKENSSRPESCVLVEPCRKVWL